jgi:hypothetical protein
VGAPTYKVNTGLASETILVGVVAGAGAGGSWVTTALSGINATTTVTNFIDNLGNIPPAIQVTIDPSRVAHCRPTKVTATLIYKSVVVNAGKTAFTTVNQTFVAGVTSVTLTLSFASTDTYTVGVDPAPQVVLIYS